MTIANDKIRHLRYEALRKQLSEIPYWPHRYRHKVIGKNTDVFRNSIQALESKIKGLKKTQEGESRQGSYISITFELQAKNVDEIILLWIESEAVEDFVKIL